MAGASARGLSAWHPESGYTAAAESSFFTGFTTTNIMRAVIIFSRVFPLFTHIRVTRLRIIHQNTMLQLICSLELSVVSVEDGGEVRRAAR